MDFCHLRGIYPTNLVQILDTATKARPESEKNASNKVVHQTTETIRELIRNNIAGRIVKPKPLSDVNSKKNKKTNIPREKRQEILNKIRHVL